MINVLYAAPYHVSSATKVKTPWHTICGSPNAPNHSSAFAKFPEASTIKCFT